MTIDAIFVIKPHKQMNLKMKGDTIIEFPIM